jgi:hypothetical protein
VTEGRKEVTTSTIGLGDGRWQCRRWLRCIAGAAGGVPATGRPRSQPAAGRCGWATRSSKLLLWPMSLRAGAAGVALDGRAQPRYTPLNISVEVASASSSAGPSENNIHSSTTATAPRGGGRQGGGEGGAPSCEVPWSRDDAGDSEGKEAPRWFEHRVFLQLENPAVYRPLYLLLGLAPVAASLGNVLDIAAEAAGLCSGGWGEQLGNVSTAAAAAAAEHATPAVTGLLAGAVFLLPCQACAIFHAVRHRHPASSALRAMRYGMEWNGSIMPPNIGPFFRFVSYCGVPTATQRSMRK